jgi:hypothetical protein
VCIYKALLRLCSLGVAESIAGTKEALLRLYLYVNKAMYIKALFSGSD